MNDKTKPERIELQGGWYWKSHIHVEGIGTLYEPDGTVRVSNVSVMFAQAFVAAINATSLAPVRSAEVQSVLDTLTMLEAHYPEEIAPAKVLIAQLEAQAGGQRWQDIIEVPEGTPVACYRKGGNTPFAGIVDIMSRPYVLDTMSGRTNHPKDGKVFVLPPVPASKEVG